LLAALFLAAAIAAAGAYLGRPGVSEPSRTPEVGFVIAGRTGTFRHLSEALQAAGDGDVIEVHGDGPFPTPPLRTEGKRLTIRAPGLSKPLFLPETPGRRGKEPFVTADADLRLEGLDLRWAHGPSPGESAAELLSRCALASTRGRLTVTHCRILAGIRNGCVGGSGKQLVLHSCHLVAGTGAGVFLHPLVGGRPSPGSRGVEGGVAAFLLCGPRT